MSKREKIFFIPIFNEKYVFPILFPVLFQKNSHFFEIYPILFAKRTGTIYDYRYIIQPQQTTNDAEKFVYKKEMLSLQLCTSSKKASVCWATFI